MSFSARCFSVSACLALMFQTGAGMAQTLEPKGSNGLLHVYSAEPSAAKTVALHTRVDSFVVDDLLLDGEKHTHVNNRYSISWAPLRLLEVSVSYSVVADRSKSDQRDVGMTAFGDPSFGLKLGYRLKHGFAVGGVAEVLFPSGIGPAAPSFAATSFRTDLLLSYSLPRLPLSGHLNLGFFYDGSKQLLDLDAAQIQERFAAGVAIHHRLAARLGAIYHTTYLSPFLELSLEPMVGGGPPGFGESPGLINMGLHLWPLKSEQLMATVAAAVGITGVGGSEKQRQVLMQGGTMIPRWSLIVGLGYRFSTASVATKATAQLASDPRPELPKPKHCPVRRRGAIAGRVVDESGIPLAQANVWLLSSEGSPLAVDPETGRFRTHPIPPGTHELEVRAAGFVPQRQSVAVVSGKPASASFRLKPASSGFVRGVVRALGGTPLASASILIPEADKTVTVDSKGNFNVKLPPGHYTVVVSAPRYRIQRKQVRLRASSSVILNVDLRR